MTKFFFPIADDLLFGNLLKSSFGKRARWSKKSQRIRVGAEQRGRYRNTQFKEGYF